jgi:glucose/mannose-6-phosphate isomerase
VSVSRHRRNPLNHLDDQATYQKLDPSQFFQRLRELPSQFPRVEEAVARMDLPKELASVRRALVVGMGGSAIGGELLADVASHDGSVPVTVWRDYDLPAWVDDKTLVLVCSHSGRTQESLSGFRRAVTLGLPTVVMTGGTALAEEAVRAEVPVVRFDYQGEPRSGIGYSFLGPLLLLQRLGLLPAASGHWAEMKREVDTLIACVGEEVATEQNEAKALAYKLHRRLPVIYGGGILAGAARRWKTQLNENAKSWALSEALPEAHHNTVEGRLPEALEQAVHAVLLRPDDAHPQRQARYQATAELLEHRGIGFSEVCARGDSPLSQIMTTVLLGDYASCYLAMLNGMDSSPVHAIDAMRRRMTEDERQ